MIFTEQKKSIKQHFNEDLLFLLDGLIVKKHIFDQLDQVVAIETIYSSLFLGSFLTCQA